MNKPARFFKATKSAPFIASQLPNIPRQFPKNSSKIFIISSMASLVTACFDAGLSSTQSSGNAYTGQINTTPTGGDDYILSGGNGKTSSVYAGTGDDVIKGGTGANTIDGGQGVDMIRAGAGLDDVRGGSGLDHIVVIGTNIAGSYVQSDITDPNGKGINLSQLISLSDINNSSVSDLVAGEVIDGGADGAILFVYGNADFTGVTLKNITIIDLHSTLTISVPTLKGLIDTGGLTAIDGDSTSHIIINGSGIVDFSSLAMVNIDHITISSGVTLKVDQADITGVKTIDGGGKLDSATALNLANITVDSALNVIADMAVSQKEITTEDLTADGASSNIAETGLLSGATLTLKPAGAQGGVTQDAADADGVQLSLSLITDAASGDSINLITHAGYEKITDGDADDFETVTLKHVGTSAATIEILDFGAATSINLAATGAKLSIGSLISAGTVAVNGASSTKDLDLTLTTAGALKNGNSFAAGSGTADKLVATTSLSQNAGIIAMTGFEVLDLTVNTSATLDFASVTGLNDLIISSNADSDTANISNVNAATVICFSGANKFATITTNVATGTVQNFKAISATADVGALNVAATTTTVGITFDDGNATSNEDVGQVSGIAGTGLTSINVSGKDKADLGTLSSTVTSINAATTTGGLSVTASTTGTSIIGGSGDDAITGGSGIDTLKGGSGNDVLTGAGGADIFDFSDIAADLDTVLATPAINDTIADFVTTSDKIKIDGTVFVAGTGGNYAEQTAAAADMDALKVAADTALNATVEYYFGVVGTDGYLFMDDDGTGHTHMIKLTGVTDMAFGDIIA